MDYFETGLRIARYLRQNQMDTGTLFDQCDGCPTPDRHYAHTFYAWASLTIAGVLKDGSWSDCAERALQYYLSIPHERRGHREFNYFALLGCLEKLDEMGTSRTKALVQQIRTHLETIGIGEWDPNTSNNWTAIRLACKSHTGTDGLAADPDPKSVNSWKLKDGLFSDWNRGGFATPLTYHAAICMFLADYLAHGGDRSLRDPVQEGLNNMIHLVSPSGRSFFYGRGSESLFGYASAICALETGSKLYPESSREYGSVSALLLSHLAQNQQSDGKIRPIPSSIEDTTRGCDYYVHLTVYNAYAAALLVNIKSTPPSPKLPRQGLWRGHASGLVAFARHGRFIALSIDGQILDGSPHFHDPRYYGMRPLLISSNNESLTPAPYITTSTLKDSIHPSKCDFIPCIKEGGREYAARTYGGIEFSKDEPLMISARSQPTLFTYKPAPRHLRHRFNRLLGPPSRFNLAPLPGVILTRIIIVTKDLKGLAILDNLQPPPERCVTYSCRFPILGNLQREGDEYRTTVGQEEMTIVSQDSLKTSSLRLESHNCPWGTKSSLVKEGGIQGTPSFSGFIVKFGKGEMDTLDQEIQETLASWQKGIWSSN